LCGDGGREMADHGFQKAVSCRYPATHYYFSKFLSDQFLLLLVQIDFQLLNKALVFFFFLFSDGPCESAYGFHHQFDKTSD